jgi:hypothetical protein
MSPTLAATLVENKAGLVAKWLEKTLRIYPESSANYLSQQQDQFQNPVGYRLKEGLGILFDGLVQPGENMTATHNALEDILRLRAVQDVSASQAVGFVFGLKQIIRTEVPAIHFPDEYSALELRIDELALAAFDLFMKCREHIYELKANESKRMHFVHKQLQSNKETGIAGDSPAIPGAHIE